MTAKEIVKTNKPIGTQAPKSGKLQRLGFRALGGKDPVCIQFVHRVQIYNLACNNPGSGSVNNTVALPFA